MGVSRGAEVTLAVLMQPLAVEWTEKLRTNLWENCNFVSGRSHAGWSGVQSRSSIDRASGPF
jgi:hypothetical protein